MPSDVSSRAKTEPVSTSDQRNALIASFLGWTLDAFDFFIVVMVLKEIAGTFDKTIGALLLSLTVTLAFRPVGAFLFGLMADRYGRRIPLMIDVVFYSIIEIATGLAPNYATFLVLRALFGIGMGGEWGVGASLAMEAVPSRWRGILSGVLQEGYAVGYLLAACAYYLVLPHFGWRAMFFIGGLPALLAWFIRRRVKESAAWERSRRKDWSALWDAIRPHTGYYAAGAAIVCALDGARGYLLAIWTHASAHGMAAAGSDVWLRVPVIFAIAAVVLFMADVTWHVAEGHRKLFLYLVALMAMMNIVSHGTQDLYPTFLEVQRGFSPQLTALVTIIANLGALSGGICIGLFSDRFGRRRGMIAALLLAVAVIPLWAFAPATGLLMLGAFLIQFGVQGAWGVVPAHITELSPDSVRGFMPGFAYQCGALIAGTVPYLEGVLARSLNYDKAMAATALTVFLVCIVVISLGKEKKGIEFGA